jgi:archaetidylinositol phosphate synthase
MAAATATVVFKEARREVQGVTASAERRAIRFLCERLPAWVQSDHLTALGLLATVGVGAAYALAARAPGWLYVVNLLLVVNWFGDSLDGSLARFRRRERPRYGFYIDHIVDAVGAVMVIGGLGLSGLMSPAAAAVLLIAYYLMAIHVYLATYTAGTFKISYGPIGGTELRILLAAANIAALYWPRLFVGGVDLRLFDVLAAFMTIGLLATFATSVPRVALALRRADGGALTSR